MNFIIFSLCLKRIVYEGIECWRGGGGRWLGERGLGGVETHNLCEAHQLIR